MRMAPGMLLGPWTPKMCASIRHLALVVGAVALVAVGAGCSLNPQPLPPGDGPDGGVAAQPEVDAAAGGAADSGALLGANDGGASDGTTPAIPPPDGATDAAVLDGTSDAPADGQTSSDGATEQ
jgi:hypothetical protein